MIDDIKTEGSELARCAGEAQRLAVEVASSDTASRDARARLIESAARVLSQASVKLGQTPGVATSPLPTDEAGRPVGERAWDLTCTVTALRAQAADWASIDEAVAALQTAACVFSESAAAVPARIQKLCEVQPRNPGRIHPQP